MNLDEIDWLECCLGERGSDGLKRTPYKWQGRGKLAVADRVNDIDWFYKIGFGQFD